MFTTKDAQSNVSYSEIEKEGNTLVDEFAYERKRTSGISLEIAFIHLEIRLSTKDESGDDPDAEGDGEIDETN